MSADRYVRALLAALAAVMTAEMAWFIFSGCVFGDGTLDWLRYVVGPVAGVAAAAYILPRKHWALWCWIIAANCLAILGFVVAINPAHTEYPEMILVHIHNAVIDVAYNAPAGIAACLVFTWLGLKTKNGSDA